jgi:hypothetical protein
MARMMNALQLALGSVGSGIQGYAQARAAREEQERLAAAFERQQQQDEEGRQVRLGELMSQGWEPMADVRRKQQDAVGAAGSLIGSALNAASGNAALPMPSESAQASLAGGYAGARPSRTINFGGRELTLRETQPERQERLSSAAQVSAAKEKQEQRRIKDQDEKELASLYQSAYSDKSGKPMPYNQALASVKQGKNPIESGFTPKLMSEQEARAIAISEGNLEVARQGAELSEKRFGLEERKFTFDKTKESKTKVEKDAKLAAAKKAANDVLPTVIDASNAVNKWGEAEVKSLDPFRIAAQNSAVLEGGLWGAIKSKVLSKTGITDLDKQYLQYSSAVADAVARASEVGVLTNQDINRFRSQVSFDGGENEAQIRFKLKNLKSWASWLANSKKNIDAADGDINTPSSNYGSVARIPTETDKEYESRTGKSSAGANANPYR